MEDNSVLPGKFTISIGIFKHSYGLWRLPEGNHYELWATVTFTRGYTGLTFLRPSHLGTAGGVAGTTRSRGGEEETHPVGVGALRNVEL